MAMTDLFGNEIKERKKATEKPDGIVVSIHLKLKSNEYNQVLAISRKFGMSVSRYCRDAVRQQVRDHEMILSND